MATRDSQHKKAFISLNNINPLVFVISVLHFLWSKNCTSWHELHASKSQSFFPCASHRHSPTCGKSACRKPTCAGTPQGSLNGLQTTVTSPFIMREMQSLELKDEPIESKLTRYTQFSSFRGVGVKNPKVLVANSCGQEVNICNLLTMRTRYGLDGPVIESQYGRNFPHPSTPVLGPTQSPIHGVQGLFPGRKATWAWR
jgi:hypothetical protein